VAEVYRDLSILRFTKDLSFGERKLFDTATVLLVRELSTAKNTDEETIMSKIQSFFIPPEPEDPEDPENPEDPKNADSTKS